MKQVMKNGGVLCVLVAVAACGANDEPASCPSPPGSITDLDAEPDFPVDYLHRWSLDGCAVRLDVLMSREGNCGPDDLVMGTPLGAIIDQGPTVRIYVRGDTVARGGGASGFQSDATMPSSAADTGFRRGAKELWMVPNDDAFVYIRASDTGRVEAWPLDRSPFGCL